MLSRVKSYPDRNFAPEEGIRMAEVHVREGESLESALKRFRREVKKSNIFSELKRKRHYEKPSERRQRKLRNRNRRAA